MTGDAEKQEGPNNNTVNTEQEGAEKSNVNGSDSVNGSPFVNTSDPQPKREWSVEGARKWSRHYQENAPRRLPFETQCAIFAFAYDGVPNRYLARAFDVSPATVSNIAGCLEQAPDRWRYKVDKKMDVTTDEREPLPDFNRRRDPSRARRYENIAREFEALGEAEFYVRYLTKDHHKMVAAARREFILEKGRVPLE